MTEEEKRAIKEEQLDKKKYLKTLQDGIDERLRIVSCQVFTICVFTI